MNDDDWEALVFCIAMLLINGAWFYMLYNAAEAFHNQTTQGLTCPYRK